MDSVTSLERSTFPVPTSPCKAPTARSWRPDGVGAVRSAAQAHPGADLEHDGKEYELALRFKRYYEEYDIELIDFRHDKFQGTEKARNFSSDVIVRERISGAERKVHIKMNHPLRYRGKTSFQASFDPENDKATVLQVVRNPGWVTPYISCAMVGWMLIQFLTHLVGFTRKRKATHEEIFNRSHHCHRGHGLRAADSSSCPRPRPTSWTFMVSQSCQCCSMDAPDRLHAQCRGSSAR